jgi:hypothetical protein
MAKRDSYAAPRRKTVVKERVDTSALDEITVAPEPSRFADRDRFAPKRSRFAAPAEPSRFAAPAEPSRFAAPAGPSRFAGPATHTVIRRVVVVLPPPQPKAVVPPPPPVPQVVAPPDPSPGRVKHELTEISIEEKTAVCSICGLASIKYRGRRQALSNKSGGEFEKSARHWACRNHINESPRAKQLWQRYELTLNDYLAMEIRQKGKCKICLDRHPSDSMVVDHDHATGAVRGLLCQGCNLALGHAKDSPLRLLAGARYVAQDRLLSTRRGR